MASAFQRREEGAVPGHQLDGVLEIAVALLEILDRAPPEGALALRGLAQRQHHRQRDLTLAEIVAHGLAELRLAGGVVEHVVYQLEGDAEIATKALHRLRLNPRSSPDHRAHAAPR